MRDRDHHFLIWDVPTCRTRPEPDPNFQQGRTPQIWGMAKAMYPRDFLKF